MSLMAGDVQDRVFRALADATRRRILMRLAENEATVSALTADGDTTQSAISQHLRVLRDAELVSERQQGRHRYYALTPGPLRHVRDWVNHYEGFWEERLDRLGTVLRGKHGTQD